MAKGVVGGAEKSMQARGDGFQRQFRALETLQLRIDPHARAAGEGHLVRANEMRMSVRGGSGNVTIGRLGGQLGVQLQHAQDGQTPRGGESAQPGQDTESTREGEARLVVFEQAIAGGGHDE